MIEAIQSLTAFAAGSISLTNIILLLVKVTLIWSLAVWLAYQLRHRSAALRHGVLLAATVGVLFVIAGHMLIATSVVDGIRIPGSSWIVSPAAEPGLRLAQLDDKSDPGQENTISIVDRADKAVAKAIENPNPGRNSNNAELLAPIPIKQDSVTGPELPEKATVSVAAMAGGKSNLAAPPSIGSLITTLLLAVWAFGLVILIGRICLGWLMVAIRVYQAKPLQRHDNPAIRALQDYPITGLLARKKIGLRVSDSETTGPVGVGLVFKNVLLPANCTQWGERHWKCVLLHERAHFARLDCWSQLLANLNASLFWFHPLSWWVVHRLRVDSEIACDDRVVSSGVSAADYADTLLRFTHPLRFPFNPPIASVAMSGASDLEWRFSTLLSAATPRARVSYRTWVLILTVLVTLVTALGLGTLQSTGGTSSAEAAGEYLMNPGEVGIESVRQPNQAAPPATAVSTNMNSEPDLDLRFIVKRSDGSTVVGRPNPNNELTVVTRFGRADIRAARVRSIVAAKPDSTEHVITTDDGTRISGQLQQNNWQLNLDDGSTLTIPWLELTSASAVAAAGLVPGQISNGLSRNQLTYHVRAPHDYDPRDARPALVLLHGADSNSKIMLETVVSHWPEIANRYLLIGINGERRAADFSTDSPAYNYTYINFAGKSKYTGYAGTDRESPALVAETIQEIREFIPVSRLFVAGHTNGGFLTWSLMMNFPELLDGAIPIAGGLLIQCAPDAYDDPRIRELQRRIPVAIVHSRQDTVMDFGYSQSAWQNFVEDGFPMLSMFDEFPGEHGFEQVPLPAVVDWLEVMTTTDAGHALDRLESWLGDKQFRDAIALMNRIEAKPLTGADLSRLEQYRKRISGLVEHRAATYLKQIESGQYGPWFDEFLDFRLQFEFARGARDLMTAFYQLREKHQSRATELAGTARSFTRDNQGDQARQIYQQIVNDYFASTDYASARRKIDE